MRLQQQRVQELGPVASELLIQEALGGFGIAHFDKAVVPLLVGNAGAIHLPRQPLPAIEPLPDRILPSETPGQVLFGNAGVLKIPDRAPRTLGGLAGRGPNPLSPRHRAKRLFSKARKVWLRLRRTVPLCGHHVWFKIPRALAFSLQPFPVSPPPPATTSHQPRAMTTFARCRRAGGTFFPHHANFTAKRLQSALFLPWHRCC